MMTLIEFKATDDFGSYGLNGEWVIEHLDGIYIVNGCDGFEGRRFKSLEQAEIYVYTMYANEWALTEGY